jgi:YfiH family protein
MADVPMAGMLADAEHVDDPLTPGVRAWTTTAQCGSFGLAGDEGVGVVMQRWSELENALQMIGARRLASARQLHGSVVSVHGGGWTGSLRQQGVDGHVTAVRGTALAVMVADCTPVFIAHENGVAALHAGWRGTAARILSVGLAALASLGCPADECAVHLGPAICGDCYEVGPEVIQAVTGQPATGKARLDIRAVLAEQACARGVRTVTTSRWCTRCGGGRFFSHRGGDAGRQLGVILLS